MSAPTSILQFRDIRFAYSPSDSWMLQIASLTLGTEPICGLIGQNGSGKSTLLRLAAGLLVPQFGSIHFHGTPLLSIPRREMAKRIAFLPQDASAFFDYTVEQAANMVRYAYQSLFHGNPVADSAAVEEALQYVHMEHLRNRPLSQLSGGERRRALIASVLAQQSDVLLLDEPTAGLDIHHAGEILGLLRHIAIRSSRRVILILHDLNMAALYCDRLILLREGRPIADASPANILTPEYLSHAYASDITISHRPDLPAIPLILPPPFSP
jgi:iron complex transport system ATP-binding protein